jgi:hypothetical protein
MQVEGADVVEQPGCVQIAALLLRGKGDSPQRSWRASLFREHSRCARACAYSFRHAR